MGDWRPDPRRPGGWIYDRDSPDPDPSVTSMVPIIKPSPRPRGQDAPDIVNTEKFGPLDEVLLQPPQDPTWRARGETA